MRRFFFSLLCGFSRGRVSAFVSIHFLPFVLSSFRDRNVILKNVSFVRSFVCFFCFVFVFVFLRFLSRQTEILIFFLLHYGEFSLNFDVNGILLL